jgi:hypothetical protein
VATSVQRYLPEHKAAWDEFVHGAKNATFLFYRDYMGYHDSRFSDHSLMIERDGALIALLPANASAGVLESHGGLTYGGLIVGDHMTTAMMMEVFGAVVDHAADAGFSALLYKTVPAIYHRRPAEEDRYALFRAGAELVRREVLSVLEPAAGSPSQQRRRRAMLNLRPSGRYWKHCWTSATALRRFTHWTKLSFCTAAFPSTSAYLRLVTGLEIFKLAP